MAVFDDDDRPKKKVAHEIGQDLSLLSVEELALRIQLMQDEIKRLEADGIKRILLTPPNAIYDQVLESWGKQVIEKY